VVFKQASQWLTGNLPNAKFENTSSTSAAVKSLLPSKPKTIAAIGTYPACENYGAPVLAEGIQNEPNVTLFFVIEKKCPDLRHMDRVLMLLPEGTGDDIEKATTIVVEECCRASTNWQLKLDGAGTTPYFFEVNGIYGNLNVYGAVTRLRDECDGVSVVGGYNNVCITTLLPVL